MTIAELLGASPGLFAGVVFLFSLLVGSFLNVVIHRLPIMMEREWRAEFAAMEGRRTDEPGEPYNLVVPRSRCPGCGGTITAWQNIPVVSFLLLKGRCSRCGEPISWRYPAVELLTALAAAIVAWRFGFGWEALAGLSLTYALIALSGIDIDTQLLPDNIVLPFLWLGLALTLAHPLAGAQTLFIAPAEAIIGALAGYLSLWSVASLFKLVTGRIGMGNGDFKLLALFGAWLGWQALPLIILLSAGVGAAVGIAMIALGGRDRQLPIPFGPFLAAAGWLAMLWGPAIVRRYLALFGG